MPRIVSVVLVVSVLAGTVIALATRGGREESVPGAPGDRAAARGLVSAYEKTAQERFESQIDAKPGTRRPLGEFGLAGGRSLRLYSVETRKGESCLVHEDSGIGQSAGCLEDGLFLLRRAAFAVNTDGGPGRFDELYVVGVVAPGVRGVEVVDTGGGRHSLALNPERAFLFQSSSSDLAAGIHPRALLLYSNAGRLLETITIPAVG
jgi:hypothetical protein